MAERMTEVMQEEVLIESKYPAMKIASRTIYQKHSNSQNKNTER